MKADIFNKLALKFLLTKQELSYIKVLERRKRLFIDRGFSSNSEDEDGRNEGKRRRHRKLASTDLMLDQNL